MALIALPAVTRVASSPLQVGVDTKPPRRRPQPPKGQPPKSQSQQQGQSEDAGRTEGGRKTPAGRNNAQADDAQKTPAEVKEDAASLARIARDTGDAFPPAGVSTYKVARGGGRGIPVWVVSFPGVAPCGVNSSVYGFDASSRKFRRLLALNCVSEFGPGEDDTAGHPDFVYTVGDPSSGSLYVATVKFDGRLYREDVCRAGASSAPTELVEVKCDGRGMAADPHRPAPDSRGLAPRSAAPSPR